MILDIGNLRFTSRAMRPDNPDDDTWLIDVERISDSHRFPQQLWFTGEPTADILAEAAAYWIDEHPGLDQEPTPVHCLACDAVLPSDDDTDYGFDNALWIGFFGGYGMFVESLAGFCNNSEDRWLTDENGDDILDADGRLQTDPDWKPEYDEPRILPGRPEHEAVICHACAHELCEKVPWIGKLIDPRSSHAHRSHLIPLLLQEGHQGWDLDRIAADGVGM